jgi:TolB protein
MPTTLDRLGGSGLAYPSTMVAGVSPILDEVLLWMLQLDPKRRPQSAAAVLKRIDAYYRPAPQTPTSSAGATIGCAAALIIVALLVAAGIFGSRGASGDAATSQGAPGSVKTGRVVFTSSRTGTYDLYVADSPTAPPHPIAALPGDEFAPVWSSDGQQIVYVRLLDGNYDIYRVAADGTGNLPVAASPATEATPAWSPDGQRIAFSSNRSGDQELYTVSADGTGDWTPLTTNRGTDWCPIWVDDDQIIYISQRGQSWGIYKINPADGTEALVYPGDGEIFTLAIAPDGGHLAFGMKDRAENIDIYTVTINGKDRKQLTNNPAEDSYPSWSPDGSQITFQSKRDNTGLPNAAQLYVVNADGSGEVRVSQDSIDDRQPAWR